MEKIWRHSKKVSFTEAGRNTFIVTFGTKANKNRVMAGKPWLFDSYLFALKELKECNQIGQNTIYY